MVDDPPCPDWRDERTPRTVTEPGGPKAKFSVDGYLARPMRIERTIEGVTRRHCLEVQYPRGTKNSDGAAVHVEAHLDDAWLRSIENTLTRLPFRHLSVVRRFVIDNRPKEHGIGPFDRRSRDDGRDGRTIWLHERLFEEPNHWARGNHGAYYSYHTDLDGKIIDNQPADHALFSPVLLHEIGHLIAYSVVNGNPANEAAPRCARVCGDNGGCKGLLAREREKGCISAYCMPFQYETGTENWAEQYRLYYQSKLTRSLVAEHGACFQTLDDPTSGINDNLPPPWERALPDITRFEKTRWASCGEQPCKPY